jgi:hypothetical protein
VEVSIFYKRCTRNLPQVYSIIVTNNLILRYFDRSKSLKLCKIFIKPAVKCSRGLRHLFQVMEEERECARYRWKKGKRPLKDRGVDGRMGSERILGRLAGGWGWSGFIWLRIDWWQALVNKLINLRVLAPRR